MLLVFCQSLIAQESFKEVNDNYFKAREEIYKNHEKTIERYKCVYKKILEKYKVKYTKAGDFDAVTLINELIKASDLVNEVGYYDAENKKKQKDVYAFILNGLKSYLILEIYTSKMPKGRPLELMVKGLNKTGDTLDIQVLSQKLSMNIKGTMAGGFGPFLKDKWCPLSIGSTNGGILKVKIQNHYNKDFIIYDFGGDFVSSIRNKGRKRN